MTLINIFTFTFNPLLVAIINYTYSINRKKRDSGFWTMWKNTSKQVHKLTDLRCNLLLELLLKLGNCSKTSHCYYLDTYVCVSSCPSPYFKDPLTFKCVLDCQHAPTTYYKVITNTDRRCDTNCPTGQFRDIFSFSCVDICPPSPPTYADTSTGNCVTVCPTMYANTETRVCVSKCPGGMFA